MHLLVDDVISASQKKVSQVLGLKMKVSSLSLGLLGFDGIYTRVQFRKPSTKVSGACFHFLVLRLPPLNCISERDGSRPTLKVKLS